MIKHTLEIAERGARLSLRRKQLLIDFSREEEPRSFACEDIGLLVLQHPAITISSAVLCALLEAGAAVLFCDNRHQPQGLLLPTQSRTELVPRLHAQISAAVPVKKRIWQNLIQAKLRAQSRLVQEPARQKLLKLSASVKSGDPDNREGVGARIYWSAAFPEIYAMGDQRSPDGDSWFNRALNYGYAVIRAAMARNIVSAGLHPALGVHHHNRDNPFCLADDLMEPFRPLVDGTVRELFAMRSHEPANPTLLPEDRRSLLSLLTHEMAHKETSGPLDVVLPRYVNGIYRIMAGESRKLEIPVSKQIS